MKKIISLLVATTFALFTLTGCTGAPTSPRDIVESWFTAIQQQNTQEAAELIPPLGDAGSALLTDDALKKATLPTEVKVEELELGENARKVTATYKLGDTPQVSEFDAQRTESGEWVITGGYQTVALPGVTDSLIELLPSVNVSGIEVPLENASQTFLIFPGEYPVNIPKSNELVQLTDKVSIPGDTLEISDFVLSNEQQAIFNENVKSLVEQCFASDRATRSFDCPNWFYISGYAVRDVTWELLEEPELKLGFSYEGLSLIDQKPLQAKISWDANGIFGTDGSGSEILKRILVITETELVSENELKISFSYGQNENGLTGAPKPGWTPDTNLAGFVDDWF